MVCVATSGVGGEGGGVELAAILLAAGASTGTAERVRTHEGYCVDLGLIVVVAVEALLGSGFVVGAVAGWHRGTSCQTGLK